MLLAAGQNHSLAKAHNRNVLEDHSLPLRCRHLSIVVFFPSTLRYFLLKLSLVLLLYFFNYNEAFNYSLHYLPGTGCACLRRGYYRTARECRHSTRFGHQSTYYCSCTPLCYRAETRSVGDSSRGSRWSLWTQLWRSLMRCRFLLFGRRVLWNNERPLFCS